MSSRHVPIVEGSPSEDYGRGERSLRYDRPMTQPEGRVHFSKPRQPFDEDVLEKLRVGIENCPDVAFAHLADTEVVGRQDRPGQVIFVWLVAAAMGSLRGALNLVSETVAGALPEDRFLDVVILNSAPELLEDLERAECLFVVRDAEERRRALAAASGQAVGSEPDSPRPWWWPF